MLWSSIKRHILIFHKSILNTTRKRFLIHYIQLIILPIYLILICILISYENHFDYTQVICGGLCQENYIPWLDTTERLVHDMISVFLIALSSICLLKRVIWQKHYRLRLPIQWHCHQKIALQIVLVSILYLCTVIPYGILDFIDSFSNLSNIGMNVQQLYFFYLFYLLAQFLSFAYFAGMTKLYSKIFYRRTNRIHLMII